MTKFYPESVHKKMRKIAEIIEKAEKIVIFGHINPDGDCIGSQLAFLRMLKRKYPYKKIKAPFANQLKVFDFLLPKDYDGNITEKDVEGALLIIPDVSTLDRIPFKISADAKIIKIDHHVEQEKFGIVSWVDDKAAAACVMIYFLFDYLKWPITSEIATALLTGTITDSGNFTFPVVREETFYAASQLMKNKAQLTTIFANLQRKTLSDLTINRWILNHFKKSEGLVYLKVYTKDAKELKVKSTDAFRKYINTFKGIEEVKIWSFCIQIADDKPIICEIRSTKIDVQKVAEKYGGGGHKNAAGAPVKDWKTADELLADLKKLTEC